MNTIRTSIRGYSFPWLKNTCITFVNTVAGRTPAKQLTWETIQLLVGVATSKEGGKVALARFLQHQNWLMLFDHHKIPHGLNPLGFQTPGVWRYDCTQKKLTKKKTVHLGRYLEDYHHLGGGFVFHIFLHDLRRWTNFATGWNPPTSHHRLQWIFFVANILVLKNGNVCLFVQNWRHMVEGESFQPVLGLNNILQIGVLDPQSLPQTPKFRRYVFGYGYEVDSRGEVHYNEIGYSKGITTIYWGWNEHDSTCVGSKNCLSHLLETSCRHTTLVAYTQ